MTSKKMKCWRHNLSEISYLNKKEEAFEEKLSGCYKQPYSKRRCITVKQVNRQSSVTRVIQYLILAIRVAMLAHVHIQWTQSQTSTGPNASCRDPITLRVCKMIVTEKLRETHYRQGCISSLKCEKQSKFLAFQRF